MVREGVMRESGTLPPGWVWTTLGDIACINPRDPNIRTLEDSLPVSFMPMAAVDAEQGVIATPEIRSLSAVRKGFTAFANGDVLFAKITPSMENGKAAIARDLQNGLGFGSTEFHVLRPKAGVSPEWVFHFIRQTSFRRDAKAHFAGTAGQLRVPASFLASYDIPLPPLSEQRRIIAEIEQQFTRLDAGVAALKRVQANLKRYRASVLKAAYEGRLVPRDPADEPAGSLLVRILAERRAKWQAEHPGKKYVEPAAPVTTGLPELPAGWCWAKVEQVADHRLGKMLDQVKNRGTLRPYLRNINVRWFRFDLSDVQEMRVTDEEISDISVQADDLVVCEGGEPGRAAVWTSTQESMIIQKALHRVRLARGISPWYLAYRLAADAMSGELENYFTGSTIKHLTGQSLRSYVFPIPPSEEQHRIVAEVERRLSVVAELEATVAANLARAGRLRQAVLKRAFEGRLVAREACGAL